MGLIDQAEKPDHLTGRIVYFVRELLSFPIDAVVVLLTSAVLIVSVLLAVILVLATIALLVPVFMLFVISINISPHSFDTGE